jgi:hypothetical protein
MLGYVTAAGSGTADHLLAVVARTLLDEGFAVAGVIQENEERAGEPPDMFLHVLTAGVQIRISQNLGAGSKGCRLDTQGLEEAAGLFEQVIGGPAAQRPRLLIINKFGKQEAEGRGFTPVIGQALANGIPVLTSVGSGNLELFLRFAGDLAERVEASPEGILGWARGAAAPIEA